MLVSHRYLGFIPLLANCLVFALRVPRSNSLSAADPQLPVLPSSVESKPSTSSNALAYECYKQPPVSQPQRQPMITADCDSVVVSILRQADLRNHEANSTGTAAAMSGTYTFGTCAIALRSTSEGTETFDMVTMLRQLASVVVSCSNRQSEFLGGTLSTTPDANPYVEVVHQQSGSPNAVSPPLNGISAGPITCWRWRPSRFPQRIRFPESDCNANIVEVLADSDVIGIRRSSPAMISHRPFWANNYNRCGISLYGQGECVEYFRLVEALQASARILDKCRSEPPDPLGELGGFTQMRDGSCVNVVLEGTGTTSNGVPATGLVTRGGPADVVRPNITTNLTLSSPHITCLGQHSARRPQGSVPFLERDCIALIGRIFNSPDALVVRLWSTDDELFLVSRSCIISLARDPLAGFAVDRFALGDVAYVAQLIIEACRSFGPPDLGGIRSITEGSAFGVLVLGSGPLPDGAAPLQLSKENGSLIHLIPSEISKRNFPGGAITSATVDKNSAKCFQADEIIVEGLLPFTEAHCITAMQHMIQNPDGSIPRKHTSQEPLQNWIYRTCKISFGTKPEGQPSRTESYSRVDIVNVAVKILDDCRVYGPLHYGGQRDPKDGSVFRVVVWGMHRESSVSNLILGNATELRTVF